jgi:uncharacterized ion transporter superfamily protein YfcC
MPSENLLIFSIMTAFAIGGMSYGMAEEAIPFIAILVPVAIKMGFDPIQNADNILVMQGGNVVEYGVHDELLAKRGVYYALFHSQFG